MLLHQQFVIMAKKHAKKLAIIDKTTEKNVTYSRALIGALILCSKFKKYDKGFIGIMIPTSAGCALATVGALMSGRIPVMINYSTGAEGNSKYAQEKCKFKTIITSRALLEKIKCPLIEGMVLIEDIMEGVTTGDKLKAALKTKLPVNMILNSIHKGNEKPILLKIAPDLTDDQLMDIIKIVEDTKIDGVIATNTTIAREELKSSCLLIEEKGGLSGKPLAKRSTEVIRFLAEKSNKAFPIIGVGGIHSAEDALEKLDAGADLVQLYTGFIYEGPALIKKINKAILSN